MTIGSKGDIYGLEFKRWNGKNREIYDPKNEMVVNHYHLNSWKRDIAIPYQPIHSMPDAFSHNWTSQYNYLVGKMRGMAQDQQYLVDLLEAKSTIDLVNLQLKRTLTGIRKLKNLPRTILQFKGRRSGTISIKPKGQRGRGPRRNLKKPEGVLEKVPALWLEYWFAIQPTIGSVTALAETFDQPFDWLDYRYTAPLNQWESVEEHPIDPWYPGFDRNVYWKFDASIRISGQLRVKNTNTGIITKMGLLSFFGSMYEVAPWSWAVDYFVNVGDLIANLDGLFDNFEFRRTCMTQRLVSERGGPEYDPSINYLRRVHTSGYSLVRSTEVPKSARFEFLLTPSLQQTSYLMSAIALTLKGKLSRS